MPALSFSSQYLTSGLCNNKNIKYTLHSITLLFFRIVKDSKENCITLFCTLYFLRRKTLFHVYCVVSAQVRLKTGLISDHNKQVGNALWKALLSRRQEYQQDVLTYQQRLGRCRQALSKVEEQIQQLDDNN